MLKLRSIVKVIIQIILSFIFWVKKSFGSQVYYVEILHNFFSDYDGIKNS